jgi:hypothetical protein
MNIWENELDAVTLFQEYGIIPTDKLCENGQQMNFCVGERVFWQMWSLKKYGHAKPTRGQ